jgi:lysophospholipase L1-like esterase
MMADVVALKPAAVLVLAGTNDIARGVPLEAIVNNLAMIADIAEFHKIGPIFASVLPVHDYHKDKNPAWEVTRRRPMAAILALNRAILAMCRERSLGYVDYISAMVDPAGFLRADLADDGLHPNSAGYRVMAPLAQAAIDAVVKPPAQKKRRRFPF